jgi:imidazole glycerol phosphate synthase subunit HisF
VEDKHELIRVITRSVAFLVPLIAICIGMFVLEKVQDTLIGAVIGASTAASIFYFKKPEDED